MSTSFFRGGLPFLILPIPGCGLAQFYISSNTILNPILAVNIGFSAPLILRALAQINPMQKPVLPTDNDA
ncbi:hypothetical protein [Aeromonas sp. 601019]|uniref:hypothetical protein n=1 Tax=unclassified Aeromonas TaxID=257493 RepID=UPI003B9F7B6F